MICTVNRNATRVKYGKPFCLTGLDTNAARQVLVSPLRSFSEFDICAHAPVSFISFCETPGTILMRLKDGRLELNALRS